MPPPLAAFITFAFIVFLYRRDLRARPNVTQAIWIPLIWVFFNSSRGVSEWIYTLSGVYAGGTSLEEGSPVDRAFFIVMILAGLHILRRRKVSISQLARDNRWLALFLVYCFFAIFWSDFPFVALKRWIKVLGNPIMVLILLTEPDPRAAFIAVMKRCAYIVLPVSVLFIKYYPQYGRAFSQWTGAAFNTGITTSKGLLGVDCLIYGFFFIWYLLNVREERRGRHRRDELILCSGFLFIVWWLFRSADSQTPLIAGTVGVVLMLIGRSRQIEKRNLGTYVIVAVMAVVVLQGVFDVYTVTLQLLGRNATLTDRTFLWADLLNEPINRLFGAGFESFWLGDRIRRMAVRWSFGPTQAHNGYLETYLNLGLIGLALLVALLFASFANARNALVRGLEFGSFRLGFLGALIVYNWTEAALKTTHLVFLFFYIVTLDVPRRRVSTKRPAGAGAKVGEAQLQTA